MQKTKILCLILAIVLASAGTAGVVIGMGGETAEPPVFDNMVNTVMDKPNDGTPTDYSAIESLFIAQGELQRKHGFVGTTRGITTSAGIKQDVINNRVVIEGNVFKEMITVGVVKNAYQLFMYNGNYLYRKFDNIKSASNIKWADTASKYSENDFIEKFGHRSDSLTGYILNKDTIISGTLEKESNGLYQYRYVLDINTAPARMLREMRTNSNMSGYSTYIKAEIIVVMDADWQVKTVTTDCKYKVPMFGGVDCVEDITETFSDLTSQDLPEKSFFEQFFDAEVETPIEKEPDALSILMDMFEPYIGDGNSLNAAIVATNNGQQVLDGRLAARIDIENIQNIEVAARIGTDLYVEYEQGNVYVTYQDFKASTTVNGIIGVINAFVPQSSDVVTDDEATDDDILSKFTYTIENGVCTVSLPLEIGENKLDLNIYANVTDEGFTFTNAKVVCGTLEVDIELADQLNLPAREGDYPEILGLLDIVQNGVIYGNVNALGMDVEMMFDLAKQALYAQSDDLSVIYKDETIYAEYGAIKAKLSVADIDRIMTLLRLAGVMDGDAKIELPQISVDQVIAMLGNINATQTDNGVKFGLSLDNMSAALYLVATENGWNIDKVTAELNGNVITLAVTAPTTAEIPEVDDAQYADGMELISEFINPLASLVSASSYGANFDLDFTRDNVTYNVAGSFTYDSIGNIRVNATVTNGVATLVKANVVVANGIVYLDVNGLKAAFAVGETSQDVDLSQIIENVHGVDDNIDGVIDAVDGIVELGKNIDISSIDFANLIKQFSYENGVLALTVNAEFVGLADFDVKLSVDEFNGLVVDIDGLNVGGVKLSAQTTVESNVSKVKIPNAADYILNLAGSVDDIEFAVSADLFNMDISASVNAFDQRILVRLVDGKLYATVGEVAIVGTIDELGALVEYVMSVLGVDDSQVNLGDVANVNLSLDTILNAISVNLDGSALSLAVKIDEFANVTIDFDSDANFVGITANVMGHTGSIVKADSQAEKLDVNKVYIPVESLAKYIVEIYNNFKNIVTTGVSARIETLIKVNGNDYTLNASINFNKGLYVNAVIADSSNVLAVVDMYLINNVLYLDANGVRVAIELPKASTSADASSFDIETISGALAQAKGYNEALDSIIDVIEQLPSMLKDVNYLDLLTGLSYDNNTLFASINGKLIGLSDFDVTIAGTNDVELTLSGLTIGNVTIANLAVNVYPACGEITAPTSEYITELKLEVMGYTVIAKLDMLAKTVTAKTTLLNHELGLYYIDNTVYVTYGEVKAKLDVREIDRLFAVISMFIDGELPSTDMPSVDVKQIVDSLCKTTTTDGYAFNASIANVDIAVNFDNNALFTTAYVSVGDITACATLINGATYPTFDLNANYVDLVALVETYAEKIHSLMNAAGYDITLNGNFVFDSYVYNVVANVVYHDGLYVNANVSCNTANMLNVELWLIDNTLYASMGDLKLAIAMPQSTATQKGGSGKIDLTAYKGYNPYVDGILDVVQGAIDNLSSGNVDIVALIGGLTLIDDELTLNVNGEQLGLSQFSVKLSENNCISANVSNLAIDKMTANFAATVKASAAAVVAPQGDFTTNVSIKIDDNNTVYANLDLINGVYNFRLDDMYVMYADNIVYINKGHTYVSGNINQIIEYVKRIDDLVNEFSGAEQSTMTGFDLDMFKNIDVKAIVSSLTIRVDGAKATIGASAFGFDISAVLAYGKLNTVTVPVELIDKELQVESCSSQTFDKFDGEHDYIQIEQVFNDYFPAFERLVHTNSWVFRFDDDAILTTSSDVYKVAKGSYFEFYYKNTEGFDTFKLRAKLDVHKYRGLKANGEKDWQPFMDIDIVYKDGNIYVTDRGRLIAGKNDEDRSELRLTVSVNTLIKCYGLYDKLVAVVPQIGELIAAKQEAESNAMNLSYATILNGASYVNGLFGLDLNGSALLSKLGAIVLSAQTYGEGLSLNELTVTYDKISLHVENLRVYASELEEKDGVTEYAAVNDINKYDFAKQHIDFNSLYELLSSFVITATPAKENNGARSFYITGTATVKLTLGFDLADILMKLAVKVDIDKDNNVYISAKITRSNDKVIGAMSAYDDYGGDSYLYYDGVNETFTVIRNSYTDIEYYWESETYYYCTGCEKENSKLECPTKTGGFLGLGAKPVHDVSYVETHTRMLQKSRKVDIYYHECDYAEENISTADFTANIIDYLFEMINLNSTKHLLLGNNSLEGLVKDNISNSNNTNDFGIEDIFDNYTYTATEQGGDYKVKLNLTPIDSNLTSATLDIYHDDNYTLNRLTGDLSLLKGLCTINLDMGLQSSTCGEARNVVTSTDLATKFW